MMKCVVPTGYNNKNSLDQVLVTSAKLLQPGDHIFRFVLTDRAGPTHHGIVSAARSDGSVSVYHSLSGFDNVEETNLDEFCCGFPVYLAKEGFPYSADFPCSGPALQIVDETRKSMLESQYPNKRGGSKTLNYHCCMKYDIVYKNCKGNRVRMRGAVI
jgi:hypothetical protein